MYVGGLISASVCCLFGGLVFERSQGSRLTKATGSRIVLLLSFFQPSLALQLVELFEFCGLYLGYSELWVVVVGQYPLSSEYLP